MQKVFSIYHFYKNELNLYGDTGNVLYIQHFLQLFGINSKVTSIDTKTKNLEDCDFIFAGGGPDNLQNKIYDDLLSKKDFVKKHIESGKPSLFICGSFQLLGKFYKTSEGVEIPGLSLFNFYTYSPKDQKTRIVGNLKGTINFKNLFSNSVVGFENHNGRTILGKNLNSFTSVSSLNMGNNNKDFGEGLIYIKTLGSYLHGPLLVKNPNVLFYLLQDYVNIKNLDDKKIFASEFIAHKNALTKAR